MRDARPSLPVRILRTGPLRRPGSLETTVDWISGWGEEVGSSGFHSLLVLTETGE